VLWVVALFCAERILTLPHGLDRGFEIAIAVGCWLQIGIWAGAAARFGLTHSQERSGDPALAGSIDVVLFALRLIIWVVVALLALENLGVNVGPLIAGLGVGGIAIALAVQTILGDLFASLSIALDKPFVIGDTLRVDTFEGSVEQIGIKSTRLRCIDGDQLVIANAQLLNAQLHNFGRATEQRTTLLLTLGFDTPIDTLRAFPAWVERLTKEMTATRFDRCTLRGLSGTGFEFETIFYATAPKQTPLPLLRQQFMLRLLEHLQDMSLTFSAHGPAPGGIITAIKPQAASEPKSA